MDVFEVVEEKPRLVVFGLFLLVFVELLGEAFPWHQGRVSVAVGAVI